MDGAARQVLIELLAAWRDWNENRAWYLADFVPRVISDGPSTGRDPAERMTLTKLCERLDGEEWEALGLLLVQVEKRDQGVIAEFRHTANRARALQAEEARRARAAEKRAQREADEDERRQRRETRIHERQRMLEAERLAADALRREEASREEVESQERLRIERERAEERRALLDQFEREIRLRFLSARSWLKRNDPESLVSADEVHAAVVRHVTDWCRDNLTLADGTPFVPDDEQATAIATTDRHALVGARAGSGKTATMVARSVFLIKACGVDPASILMLAFNVAAADEMRERLEKLLPDRRVPHVMTFHALAHRLVHPGESLLFDRSDSMRPLSEHVRDIITEFIRDPDTQAEVREVMLAYFRKDWGRIVGRGDNLSPRDQLEYRRHLQDESIKGDFVKSYGEKAIANVLFTNGIAGDGREPESYYGYEHDVRWNGQNYKPDFSIYDQNKNRRVVIEYFGMLGDPEYDKMSDEKRAFWQARDEVFLEYFPADVARPDFEARALADLQAAGAPLRRLTDDELWHRIKKRAVDRFTDAATNLVGRARQRRWDAEDLRHEWSRYGFEDADLERFIDLAAKVLDAYAESLVEYAKEDFTGLMWRAVDEVRSGTTSFGRGGHVDGDLRALRHIVVDEFQDFSLMFFELLQATLNLCPAARVMAVGDDWQAINEFAGSTTEYFRTFHQGFEDADRLPLATNRRSARDLVTLGNAVMAGKGEPAIAERSDRGAIREFKADNFEPSPLEAETFGKYDRTTPALLRLIQNHRSAGRKVAVLARKRRGTRHISVDGDEKSFNDLGTYGAYLRELLRVEEPDEVQFNSTHGFKGQEADAVILLDVTQRNYPLIHPTWTLFQVFGDTVATLTEAERRLFYVGVSRPHVHLDVVTTNRDPSDFWTEVRGAVPVVLTDWDALPEVRLGPSADMIEVRVFNSGAEDFDTSIAQLKESRFRFRGGTAKYWSRVVPAADFDDTWVLGAPWAQHPGVRVEAWHDGTCIVTHRQPGGRQGWASF